MKMITEARKLELKAESDLIKILYDARDRSPDSFLTHPLTTEDIDNVIHHYL